MAQIYNQHLWGGKELDYYSGFGSYDPYLLNAYLEKVIDFLNGFNPLLTVCDLGCGDFNVGKHIVVYTKKYIAIDIVEPLIERNKTIFKSENLKFICLDISKDSLPKADCIILRNVLQHLSNHEIQNILNNLKNYKFIILTEHIPIEKFVPNINIVAGQGIRLKKQSGVDILKPPFNFKIDKQIKLLDQNLEKYDGRIVTIVYQLF